MKSILTNLLIVEDNSFIGNSLVDMAKEITTINTIRLTESIQEAISFFKENLTFELVILDLRLPDGSGIELLKMLKQAQIETKVFVFSISTELEKICLKNGAFAFFDKADGVDDLFAAIKQAQLKTELV